MTDAQLKSELLHCAALADELAGHLAGRCWLRDAVKVRVASTDIRSAGNAIETIDNNQELLNYDCTPL